MTTTRSLRYLLQRCTTVTSFREARQLHALILTTTTLPSCPQSPYLCNNLLSMYARCWSLGDAQLLFDGMPHKNLVSYNALISAYARDSTRRVLCMELLTQLTAQGLRPNGSTFTSLLQACCFLEDWFTGALVHAQVIKFGFLSYVYVQTSLLGMYSNCGDLGSACTVFCCAEEKDVVLWNNMIFGNLKNEKIKNGLCLFGTMVRSGTSPTQFTYSMVFSACSKLRYLIWGKVIHARVVVQNVLADLPLQNSLLDMYCSCGDKISAFSVFSRIDTRGLVSWNSMISGCAGSGEGQEAMDLFVQLLRESRHKPDEYTFAAIISSTSTFPATKYGKPLQAQAVKAGLESSVFVGTTLLSMYFGNGDPESAEKVFNLIKEKDIILWTEMIVNHTRLGDGENAIKIFGKIYREGHKSDSFALSGALSACADLATLKQGEMIHSLAVKTGLDTDMCVNGSLVDMYAKNGYLQGARSVFSQVSDPDLKCWNALIDGYSQHGKAEEAITLFREITGRGLKPDHVTFLSLLSACSHSGLVESGKSLWSCMKENGIIPGPMHYSCMVSLLSRAGLLEESEELIKQSCFREQHLELWRTLLSSCVYRRNLAVGVRAAERILSLDPEDSAAHILLSNLYAAAGRWDGVAETRKKMRGLMLEKVPGLSWIEAKKDIHAFSSCNQSNPLMDEAQDEVLRLQGNMIELVIQESDPLIDSSLWVETI
ncbi:hypothetical protein K2173_021449 [Erythroxylum novogranatense]|uniref:Pentatricopeptide repeat-containing protein n=1 Tax=Erythroxylum novogranatense TaxID=1862640 RepID=A0AAV8TV03_9ROSI|nr:hypothetical protein K2173_021449 [Erythroxylum novogranatense]